MAGALGDAGSATATLFDSGSVCDLEAEASATLHNLGAVEGPVLGRAENSGCGAGWVAPRSALVDLR